MIPQETVDRILDLAQVEDVIGDFVTLKRAGATYKACCPFHNEKTPSFVVSPSKGIYKCFGCGKSGTAVGFVMEHESMTYVEALRYLAKKYNVEIVESEVSAEEIAKRQRSESLLLVSEFAGKFFVDSLKTQEGQVIAYQYFRSRGLTDDTIKKYGLGWAPAQSRTALADAARAAGYKEEYLLDTGLCKQYDDGRVVDMFHDRVMFPIHSASGRVIAFGGRTLKSDKNIPKYVNSKETEIYVKSKSLYGIYFAKNEMSRQDKCILVEGYLDVLSMHQLGITNVVASSGTSLTVEQIRLIKKFTENVTIIYDGDGAGIKAALRGIDLVLKEGLNVKIVLLPDGQDPDDFAKKHTLEQVNDYIAQNEQDFIGFKTDLLLGEAGNDPLKRAKLINEVADTVALIPDAIVRSVYVRTTASKFEIDEHILASRINKTRTAMLEAEKKQREREAAKARQTSVPQQGYDPGMPPPPMEEDMYMPADDMPPVVPPQEYLPEVQSGPIVKDYPYLAACEEELLTFVLEYGCTELLFEQTSKYYTETPMTVADFIDATMADSELDFRNSSYYKVYELYFTLYQEGLTQQQIQQRLLNSMDEEVSAVAKDILIEKYEITVKNYVQSMTAAATRLVMFVPKSLLVYQAKRVEMDIKTRTEEFQQTQDPEKQMALLAEISALNKVRTAINNELGRV
ncbi:MAG: DNA primase [Bacteroidales bacterium]|nr:DNA primase [Bacteroidales bacterium]MBR5862798.1 DNA primase [Bacteroidales bacterium]